MKNLMMMCVAALGLAACNPYLTQQSVAPPGRQARMDEVRGFWGNVKHYRLAISEGVAMAVTCDHGGPCERMKVESDDPSIAEVRPASLQALEQVGINGQLPSSAFVIIAKGPGKTRVRLRSAEGKRSVYIDVAPPPDTPNEQQTATAKK